MAAVLGPGGLGHRFMPLEGAYFCCRSRIGSIGVVSRPENSPLASGSKPKRHIFLLKISIESTKPKINESVVFVFGPCMPFIVWLIICSQSVSRNTGLLFLAQQCMVGRKGRSASHVWHAYKLLAVVPFLEVGGMDAPNLYE